MNNGETILAAVLSLRDATEQSFKRLEAVVAGLVHRLDALDARLTAVER
jgi:hypothetical protein